MGSALQVLWLKRDLRVRDHRPLVKACEVAAGGGPPVVPLYVFEPSYWAAREHSAPQLAFILECLEKLGSALRARGGDLFVRVGELPEVLEALHGQRPIARLLSHRETGTRITFDRDLRVKAWCEAQGVPWEESDQTGVVRRLGSRDGWASRWTQRMRRPLLPAPEHVPVPGDLERGVLPAPATLGVVPRPLSERQLGGEEQGLATLKSFLRTRGVNYRADMATPNAGWDGCSRLSPYLAFGALSMKRVHQETERRQQALQRKKRDGRLDDPRWLDSIASFRSRLSWHCHFMQKLEDEPALEFENMNRAFDGLREDALDAATRRARLEAWRAGRTGYPLVDACMRCVEATGWLNFRMRAMVVAFASYQLWLHWREPALHLAGCFVDYEPGIHFSQMQMQSGTTGINALRIYSPIKQTRDNDPEGAFIHRWVPELRALPAPHLDKPWETPPLLQRQLDVVIGRDYPAPIVEHATAYREAKQKMFAARGSLEARAASDGVMRRHGSRKRPTRRRRS
ncbi:MAG: FAD-binding domain-containing protein [Myxococcota bacterium]